MLWIGDSLGAVERACMRSVLRQGHALALFCYAPPRGVPGGVEVRDAAEILPEAGILRHRSGSVALFANWFRYELQRRGEGIWLDVDTYMLRPLELDPPYLFGWEDRWIIANGVLLTPPDSPLLPPLLRIFEQREVPPWLRPHARAAARWRLWRTGRTGIERMPWGSAGPRALTYLARAHGLERWALPPSYFYPVHWRRSAWVRDPSLSSTTSSARRRSPCIFGTIGSGASRTRRPLTGASWRGFNSRVEPEPAPPLHDWFRMRHVPIGACHG